MPPKTSRNRKDFTDNGKGQRLPDDLNNSLWTNELLRDLCAYWELELGGNKAALLTRLRAHASDVEGHVIIPGRDGPEVGGSAAHATRRSKKQATKLKQSSEDVDGDKSFEADEAASRKSTKRKDLLLTLCCRLDQPADGRRKPPKGGFMTPAGQRKSSQEAAPPTPVPTRAPTRKQKGLANTYKEEVQGIHRAMREGKGKKVRETAFGEPYDLLGRAVDALDEVANADSRQGFLDVEAEEDEAQEVSRSSASSSESNGRKRRSESLRGDGDSEGHQDSSKHKNRRWNASHSVEEEEKETKNLNMATKRAFVHPSRLEQVPTEPKRKRQKPNHLSGSKSFKKAHTVNDLKSTIRSLRRLLEHNEDLPADIRIEKERALQSAQHELEREQSAKERSDMIARFHKIRFFDRRKAERNLKKANKLLSACEDDAVVEDLKQRAKDAEVDVNYAMYYPLDKAYVSLYPSKRKKEGETDDAAAEEDEAQKGEVGRKGDQGMWKTVRQCMADGTLDDLRNGKLTAVKEQSKETAAPEVTLVVKKKQQSKKEQALPGDVHGNRRERRIAAAAAKAKAESDNESEGGFFE
ncbi:rRNA-processing protein Efg1 [Teratosphaeria destructans]|uniref:rRNA-processing protein EFG1 n=1 Tax=Teratosphaeria destructans TaxID=418781 RepID=A0A9W7SY22_9PEZI|nr:rRNA-processing protein Efg1 [Teratosphaeria destructans]